MDGYRTFSPRPPLDDDMLTATEVAKLLNVHVNTVKRLGDRGDLPFVRVSTRGDRRMRRADVLAMVRRFTHTR